MLRRLRESEPVSWLPALGGWLVTRADLAESVLRDARTFTVDDPRFTTARVVGPSMLSLDGDAHRRHRDPFARALRTPRRPRPRLADVARAEAAGWSRPWLPGAALPSCGAGWPVRSLSPSWRRCSAWTSRLGSCWPGTTRSSLACRRSPRRDQAPAAPELRYRRREPTVPAAATTAAISHAAAAAFGELSACVQAALATTASSSLLTAARGQLTAHEIVSDAAVMLFGGIETTEGMICNAIWYLLGDVSARDQVLADRSLADAAVEEALRLEPAAAVVDRYATADVPLGEAPIRRGDLVTVSLAGANRDPAAFADPDSFDVHRANGTAAPGVRHRPALLRRRAARPPGGKRSARRCA